MVFLRAVAIAILISAATGCAAALYPDFSEDLRAVEMRAESCEKPADPDIREGSHFRYGCFCGGGFPEGLTAPDTATLITKYYSIRPHDDIDAACRDHDVCWILRGSGFVACNGVLARRTWQLKTDFAENGGSRTGDISRTNDWAI
jgi:hypothetical protein